MYLYLCLTVVSLISSFVRPSAQHGRSECVRIVLCCSVAPSPAASTFPSRFFLSAPSSPSRPLQPAPLFPLTLPAPQPGKVPLPPLLTTPFLTVSLAVPFFTVPPMRTLLYNPPPRTPFFTTLPVNFFLTPSSFPSPSLTLPILQSPSCGTLSAAPSLRRHRISPAERRAEYSPRRPVRPAAGHRNGRASRHDRE